ncbi:DNRLRE domain-containing protein [Nocardioides sp. NPDC057577]|uniref:DNRLRE domain-containing protein n=1 Tax=Nocardioides sp. NPDC057577 TaxID=3346171 RepID=UPI00366CBB87
MTDDWYHQGNNLVRITHSGHCNTPGCITFLLARSWVVRDSLADVSSVGSLKVESFPMVLPAVLSVQSVVRFVLRALIGVLGVALTVAGLSLPAAAAPAVLAAEPDDLPAGDLDERPVRPDSVSASVTARVAGVPVEDRSQRSEVTRVFSNPDGTWSAEVATEPEQVQDGPADADGSASWNRVDTTLVEAKGGAWRPAHASATMRFAGGGGDWFATLTEQGHEMQFGLEDTEGNPVEFASPVVEGDVAIYKDVLPSTDLVVQAFVTGFEHWWVINEGSSLLETAQAKDARTGDASTNNSGVAPSAADASAGLSLGLTVTDVGAERDSKIAPVKVVSTKAGGIRIEDEKGKKLLGAPAPTLWDAGTTGPDELDPAGLALATHGKKAPKRIYGASGEPVDGKTGIAEVKVTKDEPTERSGKPKKSWKNSAKKSVIELTVPEAILTDPDLRLPLTVDPSLTVWTGDTWLQYPDYQSSQKTAADLRSGFDGEHKARSFLVFDSTAWNGKDVTSAKLLMRNWTSGSCTGGASRVARISSAWDADTLTWANQPAVSSTYVDFSTAYGHDASCPAGWASWDVTSVVRGWVGGTLDRFGLRVVGAPETSTYTWRKYRSGNYTVDSDLRPHINITYNQKPSTPAAPTVDPLTSGLSNSLTPTLAAKVSDPDGGMVRAKFEVYEGTTSVWSWTQAAPGSTSGSSVSTSVPSGKLVDGHSYTVKASAYDGRLWSATSAATSFKVDTTKPSFEIIADEFEHTTWLATKPTTDIRFELQGSDDTKSYSVIRDGGAATIIPANSYGGASVSWLPGNGAHSLKVTATDKAGNLSVTKELKFGIGGAGYVSPNQDARSTGAFPVTVTGPPAGTDIVTGALSWRYPGSTTWNTATTVKKGSGAWTGTVSSSATESTTGQLFWDASAEKDVTTATADDLIQAPSAVEIRGCLTYGTSTTPVCTPARRVHLVPSAFGGNFPTTQAGPASVALFSGEAAINETDAVDTTAGVGRTFSSYDAATAASETGPFGPGWTTTLVADGDTGAAVIDNRSKDRTIVLVTAGGGSQTYTPEDATADVTSPSNPVRFIPAGGNDGSFITLDPSADNDAATRATLTVSRPAGAVQTSSTVWEWKRSDAVDASEATEEDPVTPGTKPEEWLLKKTTTPGPGGTSTFAGGEYPTWIGQTTPGVAATCTPAEQTAGCRWLELSYTGTGGSKRLVKVERGTAGGSLTTLAAYTYNNGLLTKVCGIDPDAAGTLPSLCSTYDYDETTVASRTLLAKVTPPGQKAWELQYDSTGRLTTVTRAQDENTTSGGTATWSIAYDLAPGHAGLPDMTAETIARWGQDVTPIKVFAVFDPTKVPADRKNPTAAEIEHAQLWYSDAPGTTTNTAVHANIDGDPVWLVDTRWHDEHGNTIRILDGAGRHSALAASTVTEEQRAAAFNASEITEFNTAGTRVEAEYSPVQTAALNDGTTGTYRSATLHDYDDEEPTLGGGSKPAYPDGKISFDMVVQTHHYATSADMTEVFDEQVSRTEYAPLVNGDGNGWATGTPTKTLVKFADGTWRETSIDRYDEAGRQIETRQPGGATTASGAGSDAHATVFSYYSKNNADPECDIAGNANRAGWEGLACKTGPAGQPAGQPMPVKHHAEYNADLQPTTIVEISAAVTRTTTTGYDKLGRPISMRVQVAGTGATNEIIDTTVTYDAATGMPVTSNNGSSAVSTTFDTWGRQWTSTDASGLEAIATYTSSGDVATFNDGRSLYKYTYDQPTGEHRDVLTSVDLDLPTDTNDILSLTRDARGQVIEVGYPNGMSATHEYTETGVRTGLNYTAVVGGAATEILGFSATTDVDGRVLSYASPASGQDFGYDSLGRLTKVSDTRDGACATRAYEFSQASERTSLTTYGPAADDPTTGNGAGACQVAMATHSKSTTYDSASRTTNDGYTYDPLGRALTVPAIDTSSGPGAGPLQIGYRANDMVKSMVQQLQITAADGTTVTRTEGREYTLDPTGRIMTIKSTTDGSESQRSRYEYAGSGDSPSYISSTTDAGQTWTSQRNVSVEGIGMVASVSAGITSWTIANLHNDFVASIDGAADSGMLAYAEVDEYGNQANEEAKTSRYGYLGAHQRAGGQDTVGGVVLMGARLYATGTGQFQSIDSVLGGGPNRYSYPTDPINSHDLDGRAVYYAAGCKKRSFTQPWAAGVTFYKLYVAFRWCWTRGRSPRNYNISGTTDAWGYNIYQVQNDQGPTYSDRRAISESWKDSDGVTNLYFWMQTRGCATGPLGWFCNKWRWHRIWVKIYAGGSSRIVDRY